MMMPHVDKYGQGSGNGRLTDPHVPAALVKTGAAGLQRSMTIVMHLSDSSAALLKNLNNFNMFSIKKDHFVRKVYQQIL
jgi:hypothetical protein